MRDLAILKLFFFKKERMNGIVLKKDDRELNKTINLRDKDREGNECCK